jgi:hypothetical protein
MENKYIRISLLKYGLNNISVAPPRRSVAPLIESVALPEKSVAPPRRSVAPPKKYVAPPKKYCPSKLILLLIINLKLKQYERK